MTGAFFRLAFIAACSGCVLGLVAIADWLGAAVAFLVGLVGLIVALVLSEDWAEQPAEPGQPPRRRRRRSKPRPWRNRRPRAWAPEEE